MLQHLLPFLCWSIQFASQIKTFDYHRPNKDEKCTLAIQTVFKKYGYKFRWIIPRLRSSVFRYFANIWQYKNKSNIYTEFDNLSIRLTLFSLFVDICLTKSLKQSSWRKNFPLPGYAHTPRLRSIWVVTGIYWIKLCLDKGKSWRHWLT